MAREISFDLLNLISSIDQVGFIRMIINICLLNFISGVEFFYVIAIFSSIIQDFCKLVCLICKFLSGLLSGIRSCH